MTDLIETKRVRDVIERIKADANKRRSDAVLCPPLGSIYTGMAFCADEIIAQLEGMLAGHTLTLSTPIAPDFPLAASPRGASELK
jgi:hypothetical protein